MHASANGGGFAGATPHENPLGLIRSVKTDKGFLLQERRLDDMGRISMPQGKGNQMHNRRDYARYGKDLPNNIDRDRTCENITIIDRDLNKLYDEVFGQVVARYNEKQNRSDRKITNYVDHIDKSKNGEQLFYEDIIQWGSKDDFINNPDLRETAKDALLEYMRTFEERNPNLVVLGAYIHMDEASPHLHLDYVPVAHGYSKGLETRNALNRAMEQMGFKTVSRRDNATCQWKNRERAYFADLCRQRGLEVEQEIASNRPRLLVEDYKEHKDLQAENALLRQDNRTLEQNKVYTFYEHEALLREKAYTLCKTRELEQKCAKLEQKYNNIKANLAEYKQAKDKYALDHEAERILEDIGLSDKYSEGMKTLTESYTEKHNRLLQLGDEPER